MKRYDPALLEGYLEKRGEGFMQSWRLRHFVLWPNHTIEYRRKANDKEVSGVILLYKNTVVSAMPSKKSSEFSITPFEDARVYVLRAKDEVNRNQWICAVEAAIREAPAHSEEENHLRMSSYEHKLPAARPPSTAMFDAVTEESLPREGSSRGGSTADEGTASPVALKQPQRPSHSPPLARPMTTGSQSRRQSALSANSHMQRPFSGSPTTLGKRGSSVSPEQVLHALQQQRHGEGGNRDHIMISPSASPSLGRSPAVSRRSSTTRTPRPPSISPEEGQLAEKDRAWACSRACPPLTHSNLAIYVFSTVPQSGVGATADT